MLKNKKIRQKFAVLLGTGMMVLSTPVMAAPTVDSVRTECEFAGSGRENFVDKNKNGVCDNQENGTCTNQSQQKKNWKYSSRRKYNRNRQDSKNNRSNRNNKSNRSNRSKR